MYNKFGQFIDGKWQQAKNSETYDVINPATEEIIGKASKASSIDVHMALSSAEEGFTSWKTKPAWERSKIIRKIPTSLIRNKQQQIKNLVKDRCIVVIQAQNILHFVLGQHFQTPKRTFLIIYILLTNVH